MRGSGSLRASARPRISTPRGRKGYLAARVAAGELREHDTRAAAQLLLSTVALGQVTGAGVDPAAVVDVLLHGLTAPDPSGRSRGGR